MAEMTEVRYWNKNDQHLDKGLNEFDTANLSDLHKVKKLKLNVSNKYRVTYDSDYPSTPTPPQKNQEDAVRSVREHTSEADEYEESITDQCIHQFLRILVDDTDNTVISYSVPKAYTPDTQIKSIPPESLTPVAQPDFNDQSVHYWENFGGPNFEVSSLSYFSQILEVKPRNGESSRITINWTIEIIQFGNKTKSAKVSNMDVDRDNFLSLYPEIKSKIERATFISFDEEMTGINDNKVKISKLDDADARYTKMINVANRYAIIQFGMSIFEDIGNGEYIVSPYNFYIFPTTNIDIIMSPSSIDFLRFNNMDFQKWIGKGLPFVDKQGQVYLEKKYNQNQPQHIDAPSVTSACANGTPAVNVATTQSNLIVLSKPHDIEYMERNLKGLHDMIASTSDDLSGKSYTFESSNSYLRAAAYKQIDALELSPDKYRVSKTSTNQIVVSKVSSAAEMEVLDQQTAAENLKKFDTEMGFRLVFNDLVRCRKPIIGHNCMYDLMFLMRWLDRGPLEGELSTFKEKLHELFPFKYDTKYIAESGLVNGQKYDRTSLADLYAQMKESLAWSTFPPTTLTPTSHTADKVDSLAADTHPLPPISFTFSPDTPNFNPTSSLIADGSSGVVAVKEQFHDAGWDAYCTGLIFAAQLRLMRVRSVDDIHAQAGNRFFMLYSLYHMDLNPGNNSSIFKSTGLFLHVHGFPSTTQQDEISQVFIKLGYERSSLEYIWIDPNSLFVTISGAGKEDEDRILSVLRTKKVEEGPLSVIDMILNKHTNASRPMPEGWMVESLEEFNARESAAFSGIATTATSTSAANSGPSASTTATTTAVENKVSPSPVGAEHAASEGQRGVRSGEVDGFTKRKRLAETEIKETETTAVDVPGALSHPPTTQSSGSKTNKRAKTDWNALISSAAEAVKGTLIEPVSAVVSKVVRKIGAGNEKRGTKKQATVPPRNEGEKEDGEEEEDE